tara:strand:+ start:2806 stop:4443 length:1638 start_codon:yes stop_codon:yes gene_type:complete
MCGIFALLNVSNRNILKEVVDYSFQKLKKRGPDFSKIDTYSHPAYFTLGFHRLIINGVNNSANQPLNKDNIYLICNGEIFNFKELEKLINVELTTGSDCEIIIDLYKKYGIEHTLHLLDGEFAFVLVDLNKNLVYSARDPYGVRPLFIWKHSKLPLYGFASEAKGLNSLEDGKNINIQHVIPGSFIEFNLQFLNKNKYWQLNKVDKYHSPCTSWNKNVLLNDALVKIREGLCNAVIKRIENSDRPIAFLLSGGLDSSLVVAIANYYKKSDKRLNTYSIGLPNSTDLKYAKIVSEFCNTNHVHVEVKEDEFLDAIEEVVVNIESYDTTTVRASVGNYLIAKYISKNSDAKVILNGDGSDELCGGYLYFNECPSSVEFDYECRRLLRDIHMYDVLRSDRSISSNGLEARCPFLDKEFVDSYLSLSPELRNHNNHNKPEKYLLKEAFRGWLPNEVLNRRKEAFSDGVSSIERPWYSIIQESNLHNDTKKKLANYNEPKTSEQKYYRHIYDLNYPNLHKLIPYFWMPRFVEAEDCSARTLNVFKNLHQT